MTGLPHFETQSGYVRIGDAERGATLSLEGQRLILRVTEIEVAVGLAGTEEIELLHFRGSRNGFTLLGLFRTNSQARLGVGGTSTYSVRLALEDVLYERDDEIVGDTWLLYVEDLAKIVHVTGLQQTISLVEDGKMLLNWFFQPAAPLVLRCPGSHIELHIGQDAKTGGDLVTGPTLSFRYSARIVFGEERQIYPALATLNRIRLFFSLIMGRVLGVDETALRLTDGDSKHDAKIHGLVPTERRDKPGERIAIFADTEELARLLDQWLLRFDDLADAIHLHMDGLEQRRLPLPLRFQTFVQALEALHRKTVGGAGTPIDVEEVKIALRERNLPNDVIDRVGGMLAHAHEPGLRQRLRDYWERYAAELAILRPAAVRKTFIGRVVATRNYYAHRTDRDAQVLNGSDLWDATEAIKAISHLALLDEIGADVAGLGTLMLNRRFAEFTI